MFSFYMSHAFAYLISMEFGFLVRYLHLLGILILNSASLAKK